MVPASSGQRNDDAIRNLKFSELFSPSVLPEAGDLDRLSPWWNNVNVLAVQLLGVLIRSEAEDADGRMWEGDAWQTSAWSFSGVENAESGSGKCSPSEQGRTSARCTYDERPSTPQDGLHRGPKTHGRSLSGHSLPSAFNGGPIYPTIPPVHLSRQSHTSPEFLHDPKLTGLSAYDGTAPATMAAARSSARRLLRPILYTSAAATVVGGGIFYYSYRPINVPGSQGAAVRPPTAEDGTIIPPQFPHIRSREDQVNDLRRSGGVGTIATEAGDKLKSSFNKLRGASSGDEIQAANTSSPDTSAEPYDLLVIGGGATGSGIALDAATRGLRVALVERDDFGSGTSSKSTKLVHGGVRYLEKAVWELDYNQYKLVKEALRERKYFLDTAPHLSMWLPIMIPLQHWWQAPYFWAGTKAYDFLAGSEGIETSYFLTRSKALDAFPMLRKDNLVGALVYYDGAHNDSRMNISIAATAALYGATVVNHMEVTGLTKDENGKLNGAVVKDLIREKNGKGGEAITIRAKGVINATGPFSDAIRKLDDQGVQEIVAPSSGVHVVLPGYYSPQKMGLIDPSTSDGRVIFFLPWQGNTIAGTTDAPTKITPEPIAGEDEINWILDEIKGYLAPDINVRRGDVLAAWSGIRPLVKDPKAKNTESLVRNHLVTVSDSGLLTCAGGKWTTYRQMSEDAVDEAIKIFRLQTKPLTNVARISGTEMIDDAAPLDGSCQTHQVRLVGAHGYSKTLFINLVQHFGIETDVARHLTESYGDRAWTVAALSSPTETRFPVRGKKISALYPYVDGEVRYAVRHELAQTAVDVIARRTRLAFLNAQAALEALPMVIDLMAEELNWDAKRKELEFTNGVKFLASMGLPKSKLSVTRKDVESGKAGFATEYERKLYSRHDGPADTLESDSKLKPGQNPTLGKNSPANK